MRAAALALAAALGACTPAVITPTPTPAQTPAPTPPTTATPRPTPSATATASPTPSALPSAAPTPNFPRPSADPSAGIAQFSTVRLERCRGTACEPLSGVPAVSRSWMATSFAASDADPTSGIVAVSPRTGARLELRHPRKANLGPLSLGGSVLAYFDFVTTDGSTGTWGVWRADLDAPGAAPRLLDEFPAVILGGGDNVNPWPDPLTNGRDVVWQRVKDGGKTVDLVLAAGVGAPRVIYTSSRVLFFAIDDLGRVAFMSREGNDERLLLYEPGASRPREISRRD